MATVHRRYKKHGTLLTRTAQEGGKGHPCGGASRRGRSWRERLSARPPRGPHAQQPPPQQQQQAEHYVHMFISPCPRRLCRASRWPLPHPWGRRWVRVQNRSTAHLIPQATARGDNGESLHVHLPSIPQALQAVTMAELMTDEDCSAQAIKLFSYCLIPSDCAGFAGGHGGRAHDRRGMLIPLSYRRRCMQGVLLANGNHFLIPRFRCLRSCREWRWLLFTCASLPFSAGLAGRDHGRAHDRRGMLPAAFSSAPAASASNQPPVHPTTRTAGPEPSSESVTLPAPLAPAARFAAAAAASPATAVAAARGLAATDRPG
jgi:hypothetical protein